MSVSVRGRVFVGLVVTVVVVCLSGLMGASAWAKPGYALLSTFTAPGGFSEPVGLGVDNSMSLDKGDVYVSDRGSSEVDEFSASGTLLKQLSVPGSAVDGLTVDSFPGLLEGDVYVVGHESGVLYRFAPGLGSREELITGLEQPTDVAVDQAGDLFVSELGGGSGGPRVLEFNSTGQPVNPSGTVVGAGENVIVNGLEALEAVAVDPAGLHLYVAEPEGVSQYTRSGNEYVAGAARFDSNSVASTTGGITVTPAGYVDIDQRSPGNNSDDVVEYESSGALVTESGYGELSYVGGGVGVSSESGKLYVVVTEHPPGPEPPEVRVFEGGELPEIPVTEQSSQLHGSTVVFNGSLTGGQTEYNFNYQQGSLCEPEKRTAMVAASGAQQVHAEVIGLQPDAEYGYCLIATNRFGSESGSVASFETGAVEPVIGEVSVLPGTVSASVSAQIDPEAGFTSYYVEYGPSVSYGSRTAVIPVGSGLTPVPVSTTLIGLDANVLYHYRVVASNAVGVAYGADATFVTYPPPTVALPDGRVYEMVTPVENHESEVYPAGVSPYPLSTLGPVQAAADGNAIVYSGSPGAGGNGIGGNRVSGGNEFLGRRLLHGGWSQTNLTPPGDRTAEYQAFSSDLSTGIFTSGELRPGEYSVPYTWSQNDGEIKPFFSERPPYRLGGQVRESVLFGTDYNEPGPDILLGLGVGGTADGTLYAGASADVSHALFEANDDLLVGEGSVEKELSNIVKAEMQQAAPLVAELEKLKREVAELTAIEGKSGHNTEAKGKEYGAKVKEIARLEAVDNRNELYMSVGESASLVNILPDGMVAPGATFGGIAPQFLGGFDFSHDISSDGSKVFWTDWDGVGTEAHRIFVREDGTRTVPVSQGRARFWTATPDGHYVYYTENGGLWRFDVEQESRTQIAGEKTGVVGVLGVNETGGDGEYLYFVTGEVLGEGPNSSGQAPVEGEDNLYVMGPDAAHRGQSTVRFVATLSGEDSGVWTQDMAERQSMIAPDGRSLVFLSSAKLTDQSYPGEGTPQVYVFSTQDDSLLCASCRPQASGGSLPVNNTLFSTPRWISEDGDRVFFDSNAPLVWSDINGEQDVYEWERDGSGECNEPAGCVYLISNGREEPAQLIDASASGNDVFFATRQHLSPIDGNQNVDLYDARVDGVEAVSPPLCSGTGCQGVPSPPPVFATPASVTFAGVGNFVSSSTSVGHAAKPKAKVLTRAQKLARALRRCRATKHSQSVRRRCEAQAHSRYPGSASRAVRSNGRRSVRGGK